MELLNYQTVHINFEINGIAIALQLFLSEPPTPTEKQASKSVS
ncbi:hypothetical protein [Nostoc sp.]